MYSCYSYLYKDYWWDSFSETSYKAVSLLFVTLDEVRFSELPCWSSCYCFCCYSLFLTGLNVIVIGLNSLCYYDPPVFVLLIFLISSSYDFLMSYISRSFFANSICKFLIRLLFSATSSCNPLTLPSNSFSNSNSFPSNILNSSSLPLDFSTLPNFFSTLTLTEFSSFSFSTSISSSFSLICL